ncbi:MAG: hypothetical protein FJW20_08355 [Acidimicrobiia bacterium]|nr:hypothetical protein [Acidimicrobiia bacterium]
MGTNRRKRRRAPSGFFRFDSMHSRSVSGFGDGDGVRLRDEHGDEWFGQADLQDDETIRYRFRDSKGNTISGISDGYGILLRDQKGRTWRGFVY